jgi:hypothetical protein
MLWRILVKRWVYRGRSVPKAPGDAPSTATGFPPKTQPMSAGGRESQSIAFLNMPGINPVRIGAALSRAITEDAYTK